MNSESVDLIYLDPPFNSKRNYSAPIGSKAAGASFKDMWTWADVDEDLLESIVVDYPFLVQFIQSIGAIHSPAMMAYVTYMTQRIIQLHRVLKSTGSFYIHVDPTASHYLKIILDRVFGSKNFKNEIIWQRASGAKGSQHAPKSWGASTDTILFYTKSKNYTIVPTRPITDKEILADFPFTDHVGERYKTGIPIFCARSMGARPNLCFEWRGFTNPHLSGWRLSKSTLEEEYQKGNVVIKPNGKLERRKYLKDYKGKPLSNNWTDINNARGDESLGYPTQKPVALLDRVIKASSNPGDVVLDPFAGCATTLVSAQHLKRAWIGIDIEEKATDMVIQRLSSATGLFSDFVHCKTIPERTDVKTEKPTTPGVKTRLHKDQDGICNGCDTHYEEKDLEIDHVQPKSKGGGDYYGNYQLLCGHCNRVKGNRPMEHLRNRIRHINVVKTRVGF